MTITERLNLLTHSNLYRSRRAFAKAAGINEVTLSDNINKGTEPRFSTLEAILFANPNISAEWLMRGEGEMFRDGSTNTVNIQQPTVSNDGVAGVNHFHASEALVENMKREIETLTEEVKSKNRQIESLLSLLHEKQKQ